MDIPKRTFSMNKKIDLLMNKNQKIDYSTSDSLHNKNNGTEYEEIDYSQVQTNSDIENVQSQINDLNNETSELQKEINALKQEMNATKEELKKYKENNPTTGYKLINEYDKAAILDSQINQYSNNIHNKLEEIGNLNKEKEELLKQLNIRKYLSNGKELTDEELEQFEKLAMYAPFLFVAEEMGYKKYNGYEWNYDYNGYDSYNDLINAMKNKGITTEDIDKSLPNGEKIDWSKVESALSKSVTNLDIALSLKLKESNAANIFYQGEATRDFISRIEYMQDSEIEEAYTIYTNQGLDKFKEYLDSKNAVINQREGLISALNFLSTIDLEDPKYQDYIKTHFKGLEDGLEQFGHGMEVFLSPTNSLSKDLTADQYEAMFIATILAQSNSNVDLGVLGEFNALEKVYNLSMAEGNMLPSMLAGTLGSVFGLEGLGAFTMFCSVTGTSAESAYQQGYDLYSSWFYGALSGASEATLEYLLGGIPGVSKIADKNFLTKIFSEGVEESLQEILDPYLKYMATGEKPEINWESVLEAGIDGMILAAYLNGGEVVINGGVTISSEFLQEHYDEIKSLETSGIKIDYNRLMEDGYVDNLLSYDSKSIENDLKDVMYYHDLKYGQGQAYNVIMAFLDPTSGHYGDYNLISSNNGARKIFEKYSIQQIRAAMSDIYQKSMGYSITYQVNNNTYTSYFDSLNTGNNNYGVNQAYMYDQYYWEYEGYKYSERQIQNMIKKGYQFDTAKLKKLANSEYARLKQKLISQGFTKQAASVLISGLDQVGACSYADVCNGIFAQYANNPSGFKNAFGYDMYTVDNYGNTTLNSGELLLDLYSYVNMYENGGSMFIRNADGTITYNQNALSSDFDAFGRVKIDSSNQKYMSTSHGLNVNLIQRFLSSKGSGVNIKSYNITSNNLSRPYSTSQMSMIIGNVDNCLKNGLNVSMGIYQDVNHPIRMELIDDYGNVTEVVSTLSWSEGGGHAVFITGLDPRGFVVSSWGKKYIIPYEDIQNGAPSIIYSWYLN